MIISAHAKFTNQIRRLQEVRRQITCPCRFGLTSFGRTFSIEFGNVGHLFKTKEKSIPILSATPSSRSVSQQGSDEGESKFAHGTRPLRCAALSCRVAAPRRQNHARAIEASSPASNIIPFALLLFSPLASMSSFFILSPSASNLFQNEPSKCRVLQRVSLFLFFASSPLRMQESTRLRCGLQVQAKISVFVCVCSSPCSYVCVCVCECAQVCLEESTITIQRRPVATQAAVATSVSSQYHQCAAVPRERSFKAASVDLSN